VTGPIRGQAVLYFRPDSALLVAIGSRSEGPKTGVYYYRWNGDRLELLKTELERPVSGEMKPKSDARTPGGSR
jgi:hypothetical protein